LNYRINTDSALWNNLGLSLTDAISSLVLTPVLIPGVLRKRYRGFHLELIEKPAPVPGTHRRQKL